MSTSDWTDVSWNVGRIERTWKVDLSILLTHVGSIGSVTFCIEVMAVWPNLGKLGGISVMARRGSWPNKNDRDLHLTVLRLLNDLEQDVLAQRWPEDEKK